MTRALTLEEYPNPDPNPNPNPNPNPHPNPNQEIMLEESTVHPVSSPVTICGDIHGQVRVSVLGLGLG